jgi:hypothetical protein
MGGGAVKNYHTGCDLFPLTIGGSLYTIRGMKLLDNKLAKRDRESEPLDYEARNRGPGITYVQLKMWSSQAQHHDDVVSAEQVLESLG